MYGFNLNTLGLRMNEDNKAILLDEECFKCLARGGVIHSGKIRIALSDIGFDRMEIAIRSALQGHEIYKDHHKDEL